MMSSTDGKATAVILFTSHVLFTVVEALVNSDYRKQETKQQNPAPK